MPLDEESNGTRTLFPGMVIPTSRLSPITQNILKYVPLPNTVSLPTSSNVGEVASGESGPAARQVGGV